MPEVSGGYMSKIRLGVLGALAVLLAGSAVFNNGAQAAVWQTEHEWNAEWEKRYQKWVREEWTADFFAKRNRNGVRNPYYGMRNDCADTVYTMRMIFAFENKLPFKIKDHTSVSYRTISNEMNRWNGYRSELTRFKKFWAYVSKSKGSTRSLPNDSYPVAVNRERITPGTFILASRKQHHSWTIRRVLSTGIPHLVYNSTIGAGASPQLKQNIKWPNPYWMFAKAIRGGYPQPSSHVGVRAFRWPEHIGKPVWEVPGYSREQYEIKVKHWRNTVQRKLALRGEGTNGKLVRLLDNVCLGLRDRVQTVRDTINFIIRQGERCLTRSEVAIHSTPSKDRRLFYAMMELRNTFKSANKEAIPYQLRQRLYKIFPYISSSASYEKRNMRYSSLNEHSYCRITYLRGRTIDLAEAKRRMFKGLLNTNPNEPTFVRWGEKWSSWRTDMCNDYGDTWRPRL